MAPQPPTQGIQGPSTLQTPVKATISTVGTFFFKSRLRKTSRPKPEPQVTPTLTTVSPLSPPRKPKISSPLSAPAKTFKSTSAEGCLNRKKWLSDASSVSLKTSIPRRREKLFKEKRLGSAFTQSQNLKRSGRWACLTIQHLRWTISCKIVSRHLTHRIEIAVKRKLIPLRMPPWIKNLLSLILLLKIIIQKSWSIIPTWSHPRSAMGIFRWCP